MITDKEFSITETVNKNIEKHQFPHFRNHKSLIGWCTMNYPKVLQNPKYVPKPVPKDQEVEEQIKQDELQYQFQLRPKEMKQGTNFNFKKPFETYKEHNQPIKQEEVGSVPDGFKNSGKSLTTAGLEEKINIIEEINKDIIYTSIYPVSNEVPRNNYNENFQRRVRQIGEISYQTNYPNEESRHLKKLPNSILTEQNLIEVMNQDLQFLNLHNHTWIPNDLISKIGYFATNIKEVVLSQTNITDDILKELSLSCQHLTAITIDKCNNLTSQGIQTFLNNKREVLTKFHAAYNDKQITDDVLEQLANATKLQSINLSFNTQITDKTLENINLAKPSLTQLHFSGCENISDQILVEIVNNSQQTLQAVDLSFNTQKAFGKKVCAALGNCPKLEEINFTGSINVDDSCLSQLATGSDPKSKPDGFNRLKSLKVSGCEQVGDPGLCKMFQISPQLSYLEASNLERISEQVLAVVTKHCLQLELVLLNMTTGIDDEVMKQYQELFPHIRFVRLINKYTDVKDDGLLMPQVHVSKLKVKAKKKKKK